MQATHDGHGAVVAATFAEACSCAVVAIAQLRILAFGDSSFRPEIGDEVAVMQEGDGTFTMTSSR